MTSVITKSYSPPPVDRREIMRYASVREEIPQLEALLDECLAELSCLSYKVCYCFVPTEMLDAASDDLERHLKGCEEAVVFAATVGIELDRLISRYAVLSPTKSLLFQAIGAERIESLCNEFQKELSEGGVRLTSRFSPGYGDLGLQYQSRIFALLDCPRRIGLTVNQSLIMSPSKSVTAIVGIKKSKGSDLK